MLTPKLKIQSMFLNYLDIDKPIDRENVPNQMQKKNLLVKLLDQNQTDEQKQI